MKSVPRKRKAREWYAMKSDVASSSEATGLIPALPQSAKDRRALLSLYAIRGTADWSGRAE